MGLDRPTLSLFRHVAAHHQYGNKRSSLYLMVFLIQNTQNRDARAINLKLNELIRAIDKARDNMIDIENVSDLELDELHARYEKVKAECIADEKIKGAPKT